MQYKDLLRGTVLLVAVEATALGAISGIALNNEGDDVLAALALVWWLIAIAIGLLMGRPDRAARALRDPLAAARTSTSLPSEAPASIAVARLWPIALFAAVAGAFMYFATLTEVPILQGLMGAGMGKGPALALLLAGPALSLPNMLVIRSVMGTKKTITFVLLVIIMAAISGIIFGTFF